MKKSIHALIAALFLSSNAMATEQAHWSYDGEAGPENWAKLTADNAACSGKNQSPVDLTGFIEAELQPLAMEYAAGGEEILHNGHTVQVNYAEGSKLLVDGSEFALKQFHFHAPSENHINGQSYPMEGHLVHADKDGNLAVVAVMFAEGEANLGLAKAWEQLPKAEGEKNKLAEAVNVNDILPANHDYYRFNGSLTTPPCSEGVRWLVMKEPVSASKEQIAAFVGTLSHPNNRPVQALNARAVMQ